MPQRAHPHRHRHPREELRSAVGVHSVAEVGIGRRQVFGVEAVTQLGGYCPESAPDRTQHPLAPFRRGDRCGGCAEGPASEKRVLGTLTFGLCLASERGMNRATSTYRLPHSLAPFPCALPPGRGEGKVLARLSLSVRAAGDGSGRTSKFSGMIAGNRFESAADF